MERRWQDIQERDRARQARKNKLTNNGKLGFFIELATFPVGYNYY